MLAAGHTLAQVPAGYPANYADTLAAARKEGKVVYSTTDTAAAGFLIKGFGALYPGISVEYSDMNSTEVYNRFVSERAANASSADVLWSSSMDLRKGENLRGINIFNSYAALRAKKDPSIGIVLPKDYALVMSRVMFASKTAKNPNAAKLWIDYILSKRGQTIIANQSELGSIRADVEGEMTVAGYTKLLGNAAKPIPVSADLLGFLDQTKRLEFLKQWQAAIKGTK